MSILFVLLTFLVVISVNYFMFRPGPALPATPERNISPPAPVMTKEYGFSIPQGYSFHPGHTWVMRESQDDVRVGLDSFTSELLGTIDHIDVVKNDRWIRQGQRLMTLHAGDVAIDLLSPVEGVVTSVNRDVVQDPTLAVRDPYKDGWIATVKAPDFKTNQRNLMQASMVAPWMHYSQTKLNDAIAKLNPTLAQDGGVPIPGVLLKISPELRQKLINEFFLN